jgi:hypothetical protein
MADTTIPGGHGDLPVYLATPASTQPWPGVVLIHDAFGMGQDARNQADWLASEGYLTTARMRRPPRTRGGGSPSSSPPICAEQMANAGQPGPGSSAGR